MRLLLEKKLICQDSENGIEKLQDKYNGQM